MNKQRGFTLIELLIVIAIIGILSAVAIPNIVRYLGSGKLVSANTEAMTLQTAVDAFSAENGGELPADTDDVAVYLRRDLTGEYDIEEDGTILGTGGWNGLAWNNDIDKWEVD